MNNDPGVMERTKQLAEQQKSAGAERIAGVAEAVHSAADGLQSRAPRTAAYVHEMAGYIENAADQIESRGVEDLFSGISGFARDQPVAFFGGAILAGFAISRFLRTSPEGEQS
jgi:hypothetical protein